MIVLLNDIPEIVFNQYHFVGLSQYNNFVGHISQYHFVGLSCGIN